MKKVVTINLNGRAYQVEEAGYEAMKTYLAKAEKTLEANPDKDEILADIEQAIADKCSGTLVGGKNVISSQSVEEVLSAIGPVHGEAEHEKTDEQTQSEESKRKLYSLPKEGKIGGVCAGLAAYFDTDVTVMRLFFVLLLFVTQGAMIIVYIILMFAMPAAKKPEEIAEAHGRPGTAKEIVGKVKQLATEKDLVTRTGMVITLVARFVARVAVVLLVAGIVALTGVLVIGVWAALLGDLRMQGSLAAIDGWRQTAFFVAVYLLVVLPLFWLFRVFEDIGRDKTELDRREPKGLTIGTVMLWFVAMFTVLSFIAIYGQNFRDFARQNNGYIKAGDHVICVDDSGCTSPRETNF